MIRKQSKILVLSSRFPLPLKKGDKLRIYHQIKYLSQYHEVVLVSLVPAEFDYELIQEMKSFCSEVFVFKIGRLSRVTRAVIGFLRGIPINVGYFLSPIVRSKIEKIFEEQRPDAVYVQLIRMAPYAVNLPGTLAIDYMDSFSLRMARRASTASLNRWFWKLESVRLAAYEKKVSSYFDPLFVIAEADKRQLETLGIGNVRLLKNGVDTSYFSRENSRDTDYDLAFVGNMSYHPNIVAAKFLVKEILPLLRKEIPTISLLIAGARPSRAVRNLASSHVTVSGYMNDIRKAYQAAKIFVAPIFVGSGLQNKILEAMAMGLPCVTTPIVAEAIGAPSDLVFRAEKTEEFVGQIMNLLDDDHLRSEIMQSAPSFVQQQFNWQICCRPLNKLVEPDSVLQLNEHSGLE